MKLKLWNEAVRTFGSPVVIAFVLFGNDVPYPLFHMKNCGPTAQYQFPSFVRVRIFALEVRWEIME